MNRHGLAVSGSLILVAMLAAPAARAATVDRLAAIVDRQALTVSEISQLVEIRFFPTTASDPDDHRREVLDALIAQTLRYRDVERFGPQEISRDAIDARLQEIRQRFATEQAFHDALAHAELSLDEVRALVNRQLQVEAYIRERFLPLVFLTNEDVEAYYRDEWTKQRRARGLDVPEFSAVRDEIRSLLKNRRLDSEIQKWTTQLRARANVDILAWR